MAYTSSSYWCGLYLSNGYPEGGGDMAPGVGGGMGKGVAAGWIFGIQTESVGGFQGQVGLLPVLLFAVACT